MGVLGLEAQWGFFGCFLTGSGLSCGILCNLGAGKLWHWVNKERYVLLRICPWWWDVQPKEGGKEDNKPALSWHWILGEELGLIASMVSVARRRKTPVLPGFVETASFTDGMSTGKDSAFPKAETGWMMFVNNICMKLRITGGNKEKLLNMGSIGCRLYLNNSKWLRCGQCKWTDDWLF